MLQQLKRVAAVVAVAAVEQLPAAVVAEAAVQQLPAAVVGAAQQL
jgi:hypothetical protein